MKKLPKLLLLLIAFVCGNPAQAQVEKPEPSLNLRYFNLNNGTQYIVVSALAKVDNKLQPLKATTVNIYLDEVADENLVGKIKTDENGKAKTIIPPALKEKWLQSFQHKFIAESGETKQYAAATGEMEIARAKIVLDTLNEEGVRKLTARVMALDSSGWQPVKEVEIKLAVRRLGSDLKISEEESYTTDSLGEATGEFSLAHLPAIDHKNNIVLVAKTEDHELFGNLQFEKTVPWGQYFANVNQFNERSLWATRDKAPVWLLLLAGGIVAGVWGVVIYLFGQIVKIKKLGKTEQPGRLLVQKKEIRATEVS